MKLTTVCVEDIQLTMTSRLSSKRVFYFVCAFLFCQNHGVVLVDCQVFRNVRELRDAAFPIFQTKFTDLAARALQKNEVWELFQQAVHRDSGTHRIITALMDREKRSVQRRQTQMNPEESKQLLRDIKVKLDRKYAVAVAALNRLKVTFAKSLTRPPVLPRPGQLKPCCSPQGAGAAGTGPANYYSFQPRYQDFVDVLTGCVGTRQTASSPFLMNASEIFRVMEENVNNDTGLLWQYVTTLDGRFIQFPGKARHCQQSNGHISYPFTQRWLMDKLLQPVINLVILLDAGQTMSTHVPGRSGPPVTHLAMAKDAAKRVVMELAFDDRVSVVVMNGTTTVPAGCSQRLLAATKRNSDLLINFIDGVQASGVTEPGLARSFEVAYSLLRAEKSTQVRQDTKDVIMVLTNGEYIVLNEIDLFNNISNGQDALGKKVTHLVYVIRSHSLTPGLDVLYQVADLNNLRLQGAPSWPQSFVGPVAQPGKLEILQDSVAFALKETVRDYCRTLIPTTVDVDRVSAMSPQRDGNVGLTLTFAVPVFNSSSNDYSSFSGAAIIDVSMTSFFDDVLHFRWKLHSYSFVVERGRGLVLVHPKLEDPAKQVDQEPIFSSMEFTEPTMTSEQRAAILAANSSIQFFDAQIAPGRSTYKNGLDSSGIALSPAKVLYSLVSDTDYVLVLVIFFDELEPELDTTRPNDTVEFDGQSLNLHQQFLGQAANDVCAFSGDSRIIDKVTAKISPEVCSHTDLYIHTNDTAEHGTHVTGPENHNSYSLSHVRPELLGSVLLDLGVVSSQRLSMLWRDTSNAPGAIQRFIGTRNGVYAAYPGISVSNVVTEDDHSWYSQSLASPGKVWVSERRSVPTSSRSVAISTTVGDKERILGVVGATLSTRVFAALFFNTVTACAGKDYTCHLLTQNGHFLDVLDMTPPLSPGTRRHLTSVYPWLANELMRRHLMKPVWCTTLSKGRHSLSYALVVPEGDGVSQSGSETQPCRHFLLYHVLNSNLFLLALLNRHSPGCSSQDSHVTEQCSSCTMGTDGYRCEHCAASASFLSSPSPTSWPMTPLCQCPCSCLVDMDVCDDSYRHPNNASLSMIPCYEEPEMASLTTARPVDQPSQALPPCEFLCPSAESKGDCEAVSSCGWNEEEPYAFCEAVQTTTTETSSAIPTRSSRAVENAVNGGGTTQRQEQLGENVESGGAGLGGGAIAGIILLAAVAMAAAFLFAYYKLVKPRLFNRLTETESPSGEEDSAHFQSRDDSLNFTISPLPSSASGLAPASTAMV